MYIIYIYHIYIHHIYTPYIYGIYIPYIYHIYIYHIYIPYTIYHIYMYHIYILYIYTIYIYHIYTIYHIPCIHVYIYMNGWCVKIGPHTSGTVTTSSTSSMTSTSSTASITSHTETSTSSTTHTRWDVRIWGSKQGKQMRVMCDKYGCLKIMCVFFFFRKGRFPENDRPNGRKMDFPEFSGTKSRTFFSPGWIRTTIPMSLQQDYPHVNQNKSPGFLPAFW